MLHWVPGMDSDVALYRLCVGRRDHRPAFVSMTPTHGLQRSRLLTAVDRGSIRRESGVSVLTRYSNQRGEAVANLLQRLGRTMTTISRNSTLPMWRRQALQGLLRVIAAEQDPQSGGPFKPSR